MTSPSLRAACGLLVSLLAAGGCSSGGHGELDSAPVVQGSVLGPNSHLSVVNDPANQRPNPNDILQFTGLRVTVVDSFDETRTGSSSGAVYLQEFNGTPGPYEGIQAFKPTYSPPTFRTSVGDVVDAAGQYEEFVIPVDAIKNKYPGATIPELAGNLSLRFDAPYVPLIPIEIPLMDLSTYKTGRQWLSMIVTVKNALIYKPMATDANNRSSIQIDIGVVGVDSASLPTIDNELFDLAAEQLPIATGSIVTVTGLVTWFGNFRIAPRSKDDIVIVKP
jgi:hypothetical protein